VTQNAYKGRHCPRNVYLRGAGEFTEYMGVKQMVLKPCKLDRNGKWFCEAHNVTFSTDANSWEHTQQVAPHVMVWICKIHGPEQPGS
jgi:hypothetical protein